MFAIISVSFGINTFTGRIFVLVQVWWNRCSGIDT